MMLKSWLRQLLCCLLVYSGALSAAEIHLQHPQNFQVVQRNNRDVGTLHVQGTLDSSPSAPVVIEVRVGAADQPAEWQQVPVTWTQSAFAGEFPLPGGGWYRLQVRALQNGQQVAVGEIGHVGVGEIFVVAGQSNSANWGEERLAPRSDRVVNFDGHEWKLAHDPQPGAGGEGGSFIPPLGDALVEQFRVPVGFITCGVGGSSVREWLPEGTAFPHPPTVKGNVRQRAAGDWESNGGIYGMFVSRMQPLGIHGFRAVLWHQGESDANQGDPVNTLPGPLYKRFLEQLIRDSRTAIGWEAPWFVAQVSYHVPGDESSPEIRAAQAAIWQEGLALQGPDSDQLKGDLRDTGGKGIHFSGKGQRAHAASWFDCISPWLQQQMATEAKASP